MSKGQKPHPSPPAGWSIPLFTVLPIVVLLGMRYDTPSWLSDMTAPDELLVGTLLSLVLAIAVLLWMIRTLQFVGRDQRWSWWVVVSPTVVITGVVLCIVVPA
ncbi:hypothetical protein [Rhodococcus tibetensis]|uniref:Uncharacterized protein n=1 Tax=Rhodococcus tibetensis TaxID=2965064 RepID=A0ABT1QCU8_9NOCA|nr:hypothetical protein [Rhodococcus sp. FXJ9.536]MCQ4120093.1 hypothetical protein [Rhodococcus sp. FXJ9.536]